MESTMNDVGYTQRLLLFRSTDDDDHSGKTHYFKVCDQNSNIENDTRWYPVDVCDLDIEVTNLKLKLSRMQSLFHTDDDNNWSSQLSVARKSFETIEGTGFLPRWRGIPHEPSVTLSAFGNDRKHDQVSVTIRKTQSEADSFSVELLESSTDLGLVQDEMFLLEVSLTAESFDYIKDGLFTTDSDKIKIRIYINEKFKLYSKHDSYFGSEIGELKYLKASHRSENKILNLDGFEKDFLREINILEPGESEDQWIFLSLSKTFGSPSSIKDADPAVFLTEDDAESLWRSDILRQLEIANEKLVDIVRIADEDAKEVWRLDVLDQLKTTSNKLTKPSSISKDGLEDVLGRDILDQLKLTNRNILCLLVVGSLVIGYGAIFN